MLSRPPDYISRFRAVHTEGGREACGHVPDEPDDEYSTAGPSSNVYRAYPVSWKHLFEQLLGERGQGFAQDILGI